MPKNKKQNIVGIDLNSDSINMVEVSTEDYVFKPVKWATKKISISFSQPSPEVDKAIIKNLKVCRKSLRPSTKTASLCLQDVSVVVRDLTLPMMSENEILENVRFEVSEYFSLNPEDYVFSYRQLSLDSENDKVTVMAAAAPIELLRRFRRLVQSAGFKLKFIDVSVNCKSKMIKRIKVRDTVQNEYGYSNCICIADLNETSINLSLFENLNFCLEKTILIHNSTFDEVVSYELIQVIDYYNRRNYETKVQRVILTGDIGNKEELAFTLSNQIYIPVDVANKDMFDNFNDFSADFDFPVYFKAFGSAIREA